MRERRERRRDGGGGGEFGDEPPKDGRAGAREEGGKEDEAIEEEAVDVEGEGAGQRAEKGDVLGGVGRERGERVGEEGRREVEIAVDVVLRRVVVVLGKRETGDGTSSTESCGLSEA